MTIGRNFDNSGNGCAAAIESSIFTTESVICCFSSTEIGRRSKGIFGEDAFVPSGCGQGVFIAVTSTVSFQVRNPETSIVTAKRPM